MTQKQYTYQIRTFFIGGILLLALGIWINNMTGAYCGGLFIGQGSFLHRYKEKLIDK